MTQTNQKYIRDAGHVVRSQSDKTKYIYTEMQRNSYQDDSSHADDAH